MYVYITTKVPLLPDIELGFKNNSVNYTTRTCVHIVYSVMCVMHQTM